MSSVSETKMAYGLGSNTVSQSGGLKDRHGHKLSTDELGLKRGSTNSASAGQDRKSSMTSVKSLQQL